MQHGETLHSALPWDLPWWMPDHGVFFGVLFAVLTIIGIGVTYVVLKGVYDTYKGAHGEGHH